MKESYAQQPKEIELFTVGSGQTDVIIRTNIESNTEEQDDGTAVSTWTCDEVQFRYNGILTQEDVESQIDKWISYANKSSMDVLTRSKENLIDEMSDTCNATITAGFDITLSGGETCHFSLEMTDQIMISALAAKVAAGEESVPWHADGQSCKFFSAEDITLIYDAMESRITYQQTYFNSLRSWIQSVETADELQAIYYGAEIPEAYQSEVLQALLNAEAE